MSLESRARRKRQQEQIGVEPYLRKNWRKRVTYSDLRLVVLFFFLNMWQQKCVRKMWNEDWETNWKIIATSSKVMRRPLDGAGVRWTEGMDWRDLKGWLQRWVSEIESRSQTVWMDYGTARGSDRGQIVFFKKKKALLRYIWLIKS